MDTHRLADIGYLARPEAYAYRGSMAAMKRASSRTPGVLRTLATWLIAALAALFGMLPMVVLGLVVPMVVLAPATVVAGGVLAGLVAGWVTNGFSADGSHSRLAPVVAVAVAAGLIMVGLATLVTLIVGSSVPMIAYVLVVGTGIGAGAAWAAQRLRAPARDRQPVDDVRPVAG